MFGVFSVEGSGSGRLRLFSLFVDPGPRCVGGRVLTIRIVLFILFLLLDCALDLMVGCLYEGVRRFRTGREFGWMDRT